MTYRPNADWVTGKWNREGTFGVLVRDEQTGFSLVYGWNSEDDLYFPTRGSSFHIGAGRDFGSGSPQNRSHIQFRKTWQLGQDFLTVKLGGAPSPEYRTSFEESQLLAVSYARALPVGDNLKRGRWYIEPGFGTSGFGAIATSDLDGHTPEGEQIYEVGIKVGVRLDTAAFGIVDLYLMASEDARR